MQAWLRVTDHSVVRLAHPTYLSTTKDIEHLVLCQNDSDSSQKGHPTFCDINPIYSKSITDFHQTLATWGAITSNPAPLTISFIQNCHLWKNVMQGKDL